MPDDVTVTSAEWLDRARSLKQDGWWFSDLCGVDLVHSGARVATGEDDERFLVVAQFLNHKTKQRLMVHIPATGEPPTVPSIISVFPGAAFFERETYDLIGVVFEGHENLTRIMLPDEWEGHPLRKDYGVGKVEVQFVEQPLMQIQAPGQSPRGEEARQEVDRLGQSVVTEDDEARPMSAADRRPQT